MTNRKQEENTMDKKDLTRMHEALGVDSGREI